MAGREADHSGPAHACASLGELVAYYGRPVTKAEFGSYQRHRREARLPWTHDLPRWGEAAAKLGEGGMPFDDEDLAEETGVVLGAMSLQRLAAAGRRMGLRLRWRFERAETTEEDDE